MRRPQAQALQAFSTIPDQEMANDAPSRTGHDALLLSGRDNKSTSGRVPGWPGAIRSPLTNPDPTPSRQSESGRGKFHPRRQPTQFAHHRVPCPDWTRQENRCDGALPSCLRSLPGYPIRERPRPLANTGEGHDRIDGVRRLPVWRDPLHDHTSSFHCVCMPLPGMPEAVVRSIRPVDAMRLSAIRFDGDMAVYERPTDSGAVTACFFCPSCGSRIYHRDSTAGEFISLKAGTLDDTSGLSLVAHLWVCRKQPWIRIDPELPAFDTQPDDLGHWRSRLVSGLSTSNS